MADGVDATAEIDAPVVYWEREIVCLIGTSDKA
jgi:hypothetical protein